MCVAVRPEIIVSTPDTILSAHLGAVGDGAEKVVGERGASLA